MMTKKVIGFLLSSLLILMNTPAYADVHVNGYYKKDGTYVKPHIRSNPDGNFNNNWSTYGNTNPYTGKEGTKRYPNYSIGNGANVEVPPLTPNIDFKQLAEDRQNANEELMRQVKEQTENLGKEQEEADKRFESQRKEIKKQNDESQKQIDELLKALAEDSKEHKYEYTPYTSSYVGVERTLKATSSNITENNVESVPTHEKATPSKKTFLDKAISFIKNIFK
jgi:hypothetical protein